MKKPQHLTTPTRRGRHGSALRRVFGTMRMWAQTGLALSLCTIVFSTAKPSNQGSLTTFCLGDGTGAACPCGNSGSPGEGCTNSAGAGSQLTGMGSPDIVIDTFQLHVSKCPPHTPGIFFGGNSGSASVPFGNGLLCTTGDIVRIKAVFCDSSGSAQSGPGIAAREGLAAGTTRYYQFWFRDIIGPCGAAYNTSNGVQVQW